MIIEFFFTIQITVDKVWRSVWREIRLFSPIVFLKGGWEKSFFLVNLIIHMMTHLVKLHHMNYQSCS